ncbi:MAG: hypothetical protein KC618_01205, partial [Candidatus Omnitrophica bacterium]|nr:hypothetical protein [Candidatus Omnitrophota bacterium]
MTGRWIDAGIRFFLYALIFWLPYSSAAVEICVIGAGILWIVKRILLLKSSNRTISGILKIFTPVQNPLNRWIGGFLFIAFLASLGSLDPAESLSNLFTKTFEWFAVYFLVLEVFNQKKHWQIAGTVFLITSAMVLADGLIQSYITQKDFFRGHVIDPGGRVTSSLETANGLGAYLTVLIPVGLAFLSIEWKQRLRNTVFLLFFIITMWVLVLTYSRAAWLGVLIGMAFCL